MQSDIKQLRQKVSRLAELVSILSSTRFRPCQCTCSLSHPYHPPTVRWGCQKVPGAMTGKLSGHTLVATSDASHSSNRLLFYVTDAHTHTRFLVDTGSEVTVIPSPFSNHTPDKLTLTAVNVTPISIYGKQSLTLNLGLCRSLLGYSS